MENVWMSGSSSTILFKLFITLAGVLLTRLGLQVLFSWCVVLVHVI